MLGREARLVGGLLADADRAAELGERERVLRLVIVGRVRERNEDRRATDGGDLGDRDRAGARDDEVGRGHLASRRRRGTARPHAAPMPAVRRPRAHGLVAIAAGLVDHDQVATSFAARAIACGKTLVQR